MIERLYDRLWRPLWVLCVVLGIISIAPTVAASPFGQGKFGAQVPFGSVTSMSIALGGNVSLTLAPSGATFVGSGAHTITVTSTDVEGYNLYIYGAGSTNMVSGSSTIPASANVTAAALATNTWGYNTDGTTNYLGLTTTPVLLKTATGPHETGDTTTVTYGVLTDVTKAAGSYSATVTYTAVSLNQ